MMCHNKGTHFQAPMSPHTLHSFQSSCNTIGEKAVGACDKSLTLLVLDRFQTFLWHAIHNLSCSHNETILHENSEKCCRTLWISRDIYTYFRRAHHVYISKRISTLDLKNVCCCTQLAPSALQTPILLSYSISSKARRALIWSTRCIQVRWQNENGHWQKVSVTSLAQANCSTYQFSVFVTAFCHILMVWFFFFSLVLE